MAIRWWLFLPAGFLNTRQLAIAGKLSKTNSANTEIPHETVGATTNGAPTVHSSRELRFLISAIN